MGLGSASKSRGRVVSGVERKVCVDASCTNSTNEVNSQSRGFHPSTYQDHPKSFLNHFIEGAKQEEWLKPVREDQSSEKIGDHEEDPFAVSSTFVESQSSRNNSETSTIPLHEELDKASKRDEEI